MDELIKALEQFKKRMDAMRASVHIAEKKKQLSLLTEALSAPGFWNDRQHAQTIAQEAAGLERSIEFWDTITRTTEDLISMAEQDKTDQSVSLREEIEQELIVLEQRLAQKEIDVLLDGTHDAAPAILTIYSGAGGVDAQDWAAMLERMYLRFAARSGWKTSVIQRTSGQEAGIKNVTLRIAGPFAYGHLKVEAGVHRLVRLSPYDANQARHTSFAMVEVLPELEQVTTITVEKDDVRIDVFRSSGNGGQSVNTTDSAVRLTHIPTGLTVSCQNERSQMQNKEQAWKMLFGKLEKYYAAQREEERQLLRGEFTENAWGSQIRSYVIHPYKLVKDHRSKYESKNPDAVLDGDIMPFIEAQMRSEATTRQGIKT